MRRGSATPADCRSSGSGCSIAPLTAEPRMPIEVGDRDVDVERHDDLPSVELT